MRGIETYEGDPEDDEFLVFASLGDKVNGFAFAMYLFDASSGHVIQPGSALQTDAPMQCLFDGAGRNDFPGVYVQEGGRISLIEMQSDPPVLRLYSATSNGGVVEVEYANDALTPLPIGTTAASTRRSRTATPTRSRCRRSGIDPRRRREDAGDVRDRHSAGHAVTPSAAALG